MTTRQKNIAIAKMLGWRKGHRNFPKEQRWKDDWFDTDEKRHTNLLFDVDANWQIDALEAISKEYDLNWAIEQIPFGGKILDNAVIYLGDRPPYLIPIRTVTGMRDSMFELLFQFSQYLKGKYTPAIYKLNEP